MKMEPLVKMIGQVNLFVEIQGEDGHFTPSSWSGVMEYMTDLCNKYSPNARWIYYGSDMGWAACWHIAVLGDDFNNFQSDLADIREKYQMLSVVLTQGDTVWLTAPEALPAEATEVGVEEVEE